MIEVRELNPASSARISSNMDLSFQQSRYHVSPESKIFSFVTVSTHKIECMMSLKMHLFTILKILVVKAEEILVRKILNFIDISFYRPYKVNPTKTYKIIARIPSTARESDHNIEV